MGVRERRTEVVHVRLTHEEHQKLKDFCAAQHARSVSDLMRFAVRYLMEAGADLPHGSLGQAIQTMDGRIEKLDREIKRLSGLVEKSPRPGSSDAGQRN